MCPFWQKLKKFVLNIHGKGFPSGINLRLLNQFFIEQGYDRIPVFWFMDANFNKMGVWMERPVLPIGRLRCGWQLTRNLPQSMEDPNLTTEERKAKIKPLKDEFIDEAWNWYDTGLQSETIKEIFMILGLR